MNRPKRRKRKRKRPAPKPTPQAPLPLDPIDEVALGGLLVLILILSVGAFALTQHWEREPIKVVVYIAVLVVYAIWAIIQARPSIPGALRTASRKVFHPLPDAPPAPPAPTSGLPRTTIDAADLENRPRATDESPTTHIRPRNA